MIDALDCALEVTCQQLQWEYDNTAIEETLNTTFLNGGKIDTRSLLKSIFKSATATDVNDDELNVWITNFENEISKPGREWLYRSIIIKNLLKQDCMYTANKQYSKIFDDIMFLHKQSDVKIRLRDIFVLPKFEEYIFPFSENAYICEDSKDILEYFKGFINNENVSCLFIEGDAGIGKSSLVTYIAHLYEKNLKTWVEIFGERELICIRLRDIIPENMHFSYNSINSDILRYLKLSTAEQLDEHKNAVVILDGFDELCMVEGISGNEHHYIYELSKLFSDFKLIITTRPQHFGIASLDIPKANITLCHFDRSKREEWIEKYRVVSNKEEEKFSLEYIQNIKDEDTDGICDTPMALYMLVAGKIDNEAKQNNWVLYKQIFYKELSETEYNKVFTNKNGTYSHAIKKYSELIYKVGAEIAYRMYQNGNKVLSLTDTEISDIINNMGIGNANQKQLIESCYALCSYWKRDEIKGAVEFYHNNIRDFFLCEKIFYVIDKLYGECVNKSWEQSIEIIANGFCEYLGNSALNEKVIEFLYLRSLYEKKHRVISSFPYKEQNTGIICKLLNKIMCSQVEENYDYLSSYVHMMNTLINAIQIYRYIYEPYLENNKLISWNEKADITNIVNLFEQNFKQFFIKTPLTIDNRIIYLASKGNFSYINFRNADLRYAGFVGSLISDSDMSNAIASSVDFENSDLHNTIFANANLGFSNFKNCKLENCDFTDAYFENTTLPDGFIAQNSKEAKEHFKILNIKGLKI